MIPGLHQQPQCEIDQEDEEASENAPGLTTSLFAMPLPGRAGRYRAQSYASKSRAACWRSLGFANLTRARIAMAITRELRRNKYGDAMLVDCMIDLAKARRCDS
jgi:hypothetical protein